MGAQRRIGCTGEAQFTHLSKATGALEDDAVRCGVDRGHAAVHHSRVQYSVKGNDSAASCSDCHCRAACGACSGLGINIGSCEVVGICAGIIWASATGLNIDLGGGGGGRGVGWGDSGLRGDRWGRGG